jgi:hypothetical protein
MDHARHVRLRLRFAIAMGLVGCSKETPRPETVPIGSASAPLATTTTTASAAPSTTTASTTTGTTPSAAPTQTIGLPTGGGGCGFDVVCQPEPATKKCAASYTEPKGESGMEPRNGPLYNEAPQHKAGECCYKLGRRFCGGGRPLRAEGANDAIVAPLTTRTDWLRADLARSPAEHDLDLASRWLREASYEHASVASFARVTLQLMALGAPPDLLADAQHAALDEIEHARTFLALAARRGAGEQGPAALDVPRAPLATSFEAFVVDTFLDGCLAETVSGIEIRARAEDGDDVERAALSTIADEEERHAELAWRMLAWGVRAGGERSRAALEEAVRRIDDEGPIVRWVVLPCVRALLDVESRSDGHPLRDART